MGEKTMVFLHKNLAVTMQTPGTVFPEEKGKAGQQDLQGLSGENPWSRAMDCENSTLRRDGEKGLQDGKSEHAF